MNAKHPWVDPEQIRALAERLMAPYAGLNADAEPQSHHSQQSQPSPTPSETPLPETPSPQEPEHAESDLFEDVETPAWRNLLPGEPVGREHPLRRRLEEVLPDAAASLRGPSGEIVFDDGNLAHLAFLAEQLAQGGEPGVWVKCSLQAGKTVHAGVIGTPAGNAVWLMRCSGASIPAELLEELRVACAASFR